MMVARNLSRVTIQEYILKLRHNRYPPSFKREDPENYVIDRLNQLKIRKPNAAAPYQIELYPFVAILDFFNIDMNYCENCHLPYSYKKLDQGNEIRTLCIFCYILSQPAISPIYATLSDGMAIVGFEDQKITIPSDLIVTEFDDDMDILDYIRGLETSETVETSLDEYF